MARLLLLQQQLSRAGAGTEQSTERRMYSALLLLCCSTSPPAPPWPAPTAMVPRGILACDGNPRPVTPALAPHRERLVHCSSEGQDGALRVSVNGIFHVHCGEIPTDLAESGGNLVPKIQGIESILIDGPLFTSQSRL